MNYMNYSCWLIIKVERKGVPWRSVVETFGSAVIVRTGTDDGYDPAAAVPDADGKGVNLHLLLPSLLYY